MNHLKLFCLATNKFEGKNDSRGAFKLECFHRSIAMTKDFLRDNREGIAILLEVPSVKELRIEFPDSAYEIFGSKNTKAYMRTLAISNNDSRWEPMKNGFATGRDFRNRYVELVHPEGISLLAVDMPASDEFWRAFSKYLKINSENQDICVMGKFGVDIESRGIRSEFFDQYRNILDMGFWDVLPEGVPTYYPGRRHTEHILTNSEKIKNAQVINTEDFTDYAIITATAECRND